MSDEPKMSEVELKDFRVLSKKFAFQMWKQGYLVENPGSAISDQTAAWEVVRDDQIKIGKKALRAILRSGVIVQLSGLDNLDGVDGNGGEKFGDDDLITK